MTKNSSSRAGDQLFILLFKLKLSSFGRSETDEGELSPNFHFLLKKKSALLWGE